MKHILILTAGFGEGHNTAARNLREAFHATGEADAEVVDICAISYGRLNDLARKAYLTTINHAPRVWEQVYRLFDMQGSAEKSLPALSRMKRRLREIIEARPPDVILSTYPLYSFLIAEVFRNGRSPRPPLITVVTDSITINSIWYRCASDFYVVPNDATATVMIEAGVPAEKVRADGFPVTLQFMKPFTRKPPSDEAGRKVLFMINFARKEAPGLVERILALPGVSLTATVGRDDELRAAVTAAAARAGKEIAVHGWTDRMPELMMSHHLLLSKAGGATVQESIAARLPMVVSQVVPGQEEGNVRLLLENDCGQLAETPDAIVETIRSAFADDAAEWRRWADHIARLSRPEAASTIARFALDLAAQSR